MSKKTINIELEINNLLADVQGKIHYFAKTHAKDGETEATLQGLNEGENDDMIMRSFTNAIGKANELLADYTTISTDDVDNRILSSSTSIKLQLGMPSNYADGMAYSITQALHRLLVDTTYADWLRVVSPSELAVALPSIESDVTDLRNAFTRRVRPTRYNAEAGVLPYVTATATDTSTTVTAS